MATVNTKHPDFLRMVKKWKRCRDAAAGQDAVYAGKGDYLPRLKEQKDDQYEAMMHRTPFYNATWRTIDGLSGMMFRKPEQVEVPAGIRPMMDDVDMAGQPLSVFARDLALEALKVGRVGLMVDYPRRDPAQALTVAVAEAMGLRPQLKIWKAESIINWKCGRVNNAHVLVLVVLKEEVPLDGNEFGHDSEPRYRVLDLVPNDAGQMIYRVRVFKVDDKDNDVLLDEFAPMMNNRPLGFIPFKILATDKISPEVDEPPLIDLVDMNLKHYKVSATYEHGCHFTGLPTAVISGYQPEPGASLYIGSTAAWVFPDPTARATYLEFTGAGLSALERNLERKEQQMAAMGARLLMNEPRAAETATTAAIRHSGETSILAAIANCLSMGLEWALSVFAEWAGQRGVVKYQINRNFFPVPMDAQMLSALMNMVQRGVLSHEEMFNRLKEGEIVSDDATFEGEQAKIDATKESFSVTIPPINTPNLVGISPDRGAAAGAALATGNVPSV